MLGIEHIFRLDTKEKKEGGFMSDMDSGDKFWYCLWSTLAICLTVMVLGSLAYCAYITKLRCENGYEEQMEIGRSMPIWKRTAETADTKEIK